MRKYFAFEKIIILFILAISLGSCAVFNATSEKELNVNWVFKKSQDTIWKNATVPGTVHTDLLSLEEIEDPYYRLNEHSLQWIDKIDWEYQTTFNLSKRDLTKQYIELDFSGLDTYSNIYLNDSLLLQTDNMFRHYVIDTKNTLKKGANKLHIKFDSPISKGIEKSDALNFKYPFSDNDLAKIGQVEDEKKVSIFTRKAGYHFGWDWGPRLVTSGIWKPIKLRSWNHHKIEDVFIQQNNLGEKANMTAFIDVDVNSKNKKAKVEIIVNGKLIKKQRVTLTQGKNNLQIPFVIENPELWWPNGMGEQKLYDVEVKVNSDLYTDSKSYKIGLRTIELVRESDTFGTSFYFKVNGIPVFMKGANYIPQDVFLTRTDQSNYKHIVSSAKDANMNMLRVWGGGIYENDEFYTLCDEMGLLVWQDFMFACSMYPGDSAFLENVKQEAIDNVKRLRNHTSIALWCGNNENLSAWEDWGWKNNIIKEQSQKVADIIWNAYDAVFHNILPDIVSTYDNTRTYWPSSPGSDFGEKESYTKGDAHYWKVWWGKEPFDNYNKAIPRFMSEYGFQSFPEFSSVKKYTLSEDYNIYSEVMKSHQRSSIGNETIETYMLRDFKKPKDFESFLYVSQLLQAHGIKIAMEAHRRNRDRCMGSLYWQINDCWPVASWSSIDYYGKWKALHYTAKKSFETFLISLENNEDSLNVFVVSDSLKSINANLKLKLMDFEGNIIKRWEEQITVAENQSQKYMSLLKSDFIKEASANNIFIHAELQNTTDNSIISDNIFYLVPYKNLNFPNPELTFTVNEKNDVFEVVLKTKKLAKNIYLSADSDNNFSDNYFDMLPNSEKTVTIKKDNLENLKSFLEKLRVISLVDSY